MHNFLSTDVCAKKERWFVVWHAIASVLVHRWNSVGYHMRVCPHSEAIDRSLYTIMGNPESTVLKRISELQSWTEQEKYQQFQDFRNNYQRVDYIQSRWRRWLKATISHSSQGTVRFREAFWSISGDQCVESMSGFDGGLSESLHDNTNTTACEGAVVLKPNP